MKRRNSKLFFSRTGNWYHRFPLSIKSCRYVRVCICSNVIFFNVILIGLYTIMPSFVDRLNDLLSNSISCRVGAPWYKKTTVASFGKHFLIVQILHVSLWFQLIKSLFIAVTSCDEYTFPTVGWF